MRKVRTCQNRIQNRAFWVTDAMLRQCRPAYKLKNEVFIAVQFFRGRKEIDTRASHNRGNW